MCKMSFKVIFCSVCVAIVGIFILYDKGESIKLIIIVLSSRTNFEKRDSVRSTWGITSQKYKDVKYVFAIGKGCLIHPLDRRDELSCLEKTVTRKDEKSFPNKWESATCSQNQDHNSLLHIPELQGLCYIGFGFKVLHPVNLVSLIVNYNLVQIVQNLSVVFKDPEEIFEEINLTMSSCYKIKDFCYFRLKQAFILPKGFEGEISLMGEDIMNENLWPYLNPILCSWTEELSIEYTFGRTRWSVHKLEERCTFIAAEFTLKDRDFLKEHHLDKSNRGLHWLDENERINNKIELENSRYKDIIYLSDVTDTYRTLPLKLLEMFKWVHRNYKTDFVLKVDDDTYIDVDSIVKFLPNLPQSKAPSIWGHFYYHRSVPLFGKWADYHYQGLAYPPFPSGAGYLLSYSLVSLLAGLAPNLRSFQGEDVSIGIWTEFVQTSANSKDFTAIPSHQTVRKVNFQCWLPSTQCNASILMPQLSTEDMTKIYNTYFLTK